MWRHFSVNTVRKNVFHVHGYYHFHYAGLTCTIIKVSEIFYAKGAACCLWLSRVELIRPYDKQSGNYQKCWWLINHFSYLSGNKICTNFSFSDVGICCFSLFSVISNQIPFWFWTAVCTKKTRLLKKKINWWK